MKLPNFLNSQNARHPALTKKNPWINLGIDDDESERQDRVVVRAERAVIFNNSRLFMIVGDGFVKFQRFMQEYLEPYLYVGKSD
jgi:hypothetical protein